MAKIFTKTFNATQIDNAILDVAKSAGSLQQKIHNIAVSICKVWHDSKGTIEDSKLAFNRLTALQNASPYHANAFSQWVALKLPMAEWSKENKTWYAIKDNNKLMGKVFIALRDETFWMVSPAPEAKPIDLGMDLERLIKKIEKRIDNPVDGDVIDVASLKFLRQARDVYARVVVS
tara:strand:+ start:79 stop:606 length:528 start_codon:yes stop_codon:yes gene_type:complete